MLHPGGHRQARSKPTQHPQKPWHRCHIHLKAMLLRTYCHPAPVLITPAVLWAGHRRWVTSFCSALNPWSAIEMHEALFAPAHTRAERWGLAPAGAAPFPAGGDSRLPAPSPASISGSHPERAGAVRPIPAPIPAVCRGHSGPASGGGAPGAGGAELRLRGRESPAPGDTGRGEGCGSRGTRSLERERYERFNVRHIKNTNLAHHQRSGIRQEHEKDLSQYKHLSENIPGEAARERSPLLGNRARCHTGTARE